MYQVNSGQSYKLVVAITTDGSEVDMSLADDITAVAIQNGVASTTNRWSLNALAGYGTLDINPATYNVRIFAEATTTKNLVEGRMDVEITASFTDVTYPAGKRVEKWFLPLAMVRRSVTQELS